jgi:hypothetical protein
MTTRSDEELGKPKLPIISTNEGISIRQSDVHSRNPQSILKRLSDENTISFNDVHPEKPLSQITSTDEGISIRQSDVHSLNPEIFLK